VLLSVNFAEMLFYNFIVCLCTEQF